MSNLIPDTSWWQDPSTFLSSVFPINYTSNSILNDPKLNSVNVTDPNIQLNRLKGGQIDPSKITPRPKQIFSDKFAKSTFGKNFGAWSNGLDTANNMFTGIFGKKNEYSGDKGNITRAMDSSYDAIQNAASKFGPYGQIVSLGMGANKLLGNVANKLGTGTDGMTSTDAILGSSFLQLTPLGLVNGIGGKKADTITKNNDIFETIGASYGGTNTTVDDSLTKSGKKYGLFSGGARKEANAQIAEAKRQQSVMEGIADTTTDRFNIRNSMAAINDNRKAFNLQGGYDQSAMRVGRRGLKISPIRAKRILSTSKKKIKIPTYDGNYIEVNSINEDQKLGREPIGKNKNGEDLYLNGDGIAVTNQNGKQSFQKGGTIQDPFNTYLQSLPENQRDSTNFRVKDYWIFNNKPKDFKEARRRGMFTQDKAGLFHAKSIAKNPETGEIEYMKASSHPTRYMESDWYEKGLIYNEDQNGNLSIIQLKPGVPGYEDWQQFTNDYELIKSEPYWKYVKRTSKVTKHEQGGSIIELVSSIKPITPNDIPEFQNEDASVECMEKGGSINVIPEGALHARKHNMDMDGITKKGIPVISNNGEQQAEIEREEIIYRLEVTQKLEELMKKYYSEDTSKKEKDELALEAGKLLTQETLYNTQDNTNNLI